MTTENTAEPREIIEKAAEAGREYVASASGVALAGLATAIELQNAAIDAWTKAVRDAQAQASTLAQASAQLVQRTFDTR